MPNLRLQRHTEDGGPEACRSQKKMKILTAILGALLLPYSLMADKCALQSTRPATSPDGLLTINATYKEQLGWTYLITNQSGLEVASGAIPFVTDHAHLEFIIPNNGTTLAIMDIDAERRLNDRIIILRINGDLIKSYGLEDFMNDAELKSVRESERHLKWVKSVHGLNENREIELILFHDKRFLISMDTGEILAGKK